MFILKKRHQPGVYVPLRALFLVLFCSVCSGTHRPSTRYTIPIPARSEKNSVDPINTNCIAHGPNANDVVRMQTLHVD